MSLSGALCLVFSLRTTPPFGGARVVISSADEERTALGINCGWLPYRAAAVLVRPPTVVGHVERLPKDRTVLSVERHYAAAKAATRICGIRRQALFIRRDANINNPVEDNRRSGNDCGWMTLHMCKPPERSCLPIYCDHVRAIVHLIGTENIPNN